VLTAAGFAFAFTGAFVSLAAASAAGAGAAPSADPGPDRLVREDVARADAAFRAGQWSEARAGYLAVLAQRTGPSKTLHEQIARCDSRAGNHEEALQRLQTLLTAHSGDDALRIWIAQEELRAGHLERGLARLATVDPAAITEPSVYFDIAALLLNQSRPEEAIPYLTRAIALDPAYLDGYFRRGLAYLQLGRTAEAARDLRKVVELAPQSPQAETARKGLQHLR
jgi:tetratricopeptide (TPR) repeat protein